MARTFWMRLLYTIVTLSITVQAVEALVKRAMPKLTLPYATYEAAKYNSLTDVYTFKNIRFAAPPLGDLRWAKPEPPLVQSGVQNGSVGFICTQSLSSALNQGSGGADSSSPLLSALSGGIPSEDVYVPAKAVRGSAKKLPVIVWVYGGGYSAGSKDGAISLGLYDGNGPIVRSGGNVIVVTFNYRLGVYGFLAGKTIENEGVANAGLHDQYAAFEWVHKYISLIGGDPDNVSAWGESAGAGSIYWLLTREGGSKDPLFRRAIVQSPAFQDKFDRNGIMERDYQSFAKLAGCENQGLACLRSKDASIINKANDQVIDNPVTPVVFAPAPDGKYFRQHPTVEYSQGHYWKEMDSLIPSHTIDEASLFVNRSIKTDKDFTDYINYVWPPYAVEDGIVAEIEAVYPPVNSSNAPFKTEEERLKVFTTQSGFLCNTHALTKAYKGKTYNVQFSALNGTHGADVLPTWYNPYITINASGIALPLWGALISQGLFVPGVARGYQSYLVSHARSGNPNSNRELLNVPPTIEWPKVGNIDGEYLTNVLNVTDNGFGIITDTTHNRTICDFWIDIFTKTTEAGGYAV